MITGRAWTAEALGNHERLAGLPGGKAGHAPGPGLALPNDVQHGAYGLFQGRVRVSPVDDVDIDVVGLQAPQAAVDLAHDVHSRSAEIVWARSDRTADFRGDDHIVAAAGDGASEGQFGGAAVGRVGRLAVEVGAIEERDATFDRSSDGPLHQANVGLVAEAAAEPQSRNPDTAGPEQHYLQGRGLGPGAIRSRGRTDRAPG